MKKYLLTFLDKEIEEKYLFQLRQIQFTIFYWASLISIILFILSLSEIWYSEQLNITIIYFSCIIIYTVMLFVIYKYRKWVSIGLFILSLISILAQSRSPYLAVNSAFLTSGNLMAIYVLILFALEFKYAITSNFCMFAIREFQAVHYGNGNYILIVSVSLLHICIMVCSYYKEISFRTSFLSNANNELLEKTFTILQDNPFFVFQFDQEQIRFKLRDQHKLIGNGIPSDFNHFLRFSKYNEQSLELFLFNRIKQQQLQDYEKILSHQFEVEYEKKFYQVNIVEIFLSYQTYFLTFTNQRKFISQVNIQKKYSQIFKIIYRFSISQEKLLKNFYIYYKSRYALLKLRRFYFLVACQSRIQIQDLKTYNTIKLINFGYVVKYILTLFTNIKLIKFEPQSIIQIDIAKLYFYLIQLFNFYETSEVLKTEIKNDQVYVHLILYTQYKLINNNYFERIQDLLVTGVIKDLEKTIFIFNSQWEPSFVKNLQLS